MRRVVVLALVGGCFVSPVVRFGGGKSATEAQHDEATRLTPPTLAADDEWHSKVETQKIRVYADDEYRAQNVHWQQTFEIGLGYANEVLAASYGIRLVPEYREWARHAPGETLEEALAELHELDRGDVFEVIGLTSSLGLASATFEQLGIGDLPGRYVVVRGYADVFERKAFDSYFRDLGPEERETLYVARRRHKVAAVLLHELGHNFGAPHVAETDTLMSPTYSDRSASFDAHSHDAIRATLDRRLQRAAATHGDAAKHPTLVIALDARGVAHVGGQPVDDESLGELMKLSFDDDHDTELVVRAPKDVAQQTVIHLFERARAAGLTKMTLAGQ